MGRLYNIVAHIRFGGKFVTLGPLLPTKMAKKRRFEWVRFISMEKGVEGYLVKQKYYLRHEDQAYKNDMFICIYQEITFE